MPYWRLAGLYFSYFAVVGVMSPYWGLYLKELRFSAAQIAALTALPFLTKLFAPNLWSWYADRYGKRLMVMRVGSALAATVFIGVLFTQDYLALLLIMSLYAIFWNAVLPQFESLTLSYLGKRSHEYSKIRVWGSIGFIVLVLLLGWGFEQYSVLLLPSITLMILLAILLFCCSLPATRVDTAARNDIDFIGILLRPAVLIFFLVLFFLQFSHGAYYVFYSIYLEEYSHSRFLIGLLWTVGVLSEIAIFLQMHRLLRRFSLFALFSLSLLLTAFRWALIGRFPENVSVLFVAQLLHAFSFGCAHAVAIEFVKQHFGSAAQSQGQAFYSAVSFGAGASAGAYVSGMLWEVSPASSFYFASAAAVFAWLLCIVFLRRVLRISA